MKHISSHITPAAEKKNRATERGELMEYFLKKLNQARVQDGLAPMTMGRIARLLMATPTKDLYYLQTVCDRAPHFSKKFWWEVNPKKHDPQTQQQTPPKKKVWKRAPRSLD